MPVLDDAALNQLFLDARSQNAWSPTPVSDAELRRLMELVRWGPTSMNVSPARFVFLRTPEAKARLEPFLAEGNRAKAAQAPVVAIIATDMAFFEHMPRLFPHREVKPLFANNPALAEATALRNATLQGGYLIMAARALGLDCGPMSGFDAAGVDAAFFKGTSLRANFLCALGHGDRAALFPRHPRFDFDEFCTLL